MANKKASVDTVRTGIEEITTQGDLLYRGASDLERLPKGTSGQTLTMGSSNEPEWVTVADELPTAGSSGNVLTSTGSAWASTAPASSGFTVLGAKIATTSGANVDVTGIPAGVTMVVIGFMGGSLASAGVSLNVQLGTASGLVGSGYMSGTARTRASNHPESWDSTSAFLVAGHSSSNSFTALVRLDDMTAHFSPRCQRSSGEHKGRVCRASLCFATLSLIQLYACSCDHIGMFTFTIGVGG